MDALIKMVVPKFAPIVNKNVTRPVWTIHPYKDSLMKTVYVIPLKDKRSIKYMFKYADETNIYKTGVSFSSICHVLKISFSLVPILPTASAMKEKEAYCRS